MLATADPGALGLVLAGVLLVDGVGAPPFVEPLWQPTTQNNASVGTVAMSARARRRERFIAATVTEQAVVARGERQSCGRPRREGHVSWIAISPSRHNQRGTQTGFAFIEETVVFARRRSSAGVRRVRCSW